MLGANCVTPNDQLFRFQTELDIFRELKVQKSG